MRVGTGEEEDEGLTLGRGKKGSGPSWLNFVTFEKLCDCSVTILLS